MYPHVMDEKRTVSLLLEGCSIARYGDGELNLCLNGSAKAQKFDKRIAERLREILKSPSGACLIGIPRLDNMEYMPSPKISFWQKYKNREYKHLYIVRKLYASAFITRPDSAPHIRNKDYYESLKSIWRGKNIVLINGNKKGQRFDEDLTILETAKSFKRKTVNDEDAWDQYPEIFNFCLTHPKDTLFILSIGPTATVLAFDLSELGYQALDLGHLGMFYAGLK